VAGRQRGRGAQRGRIRNGLHLPLLEQQKSDLSSERDHSNEDRQPDPERECDTAPFSTLVQRLRSRIT
jgi:hypothetical protein